MAVQQGGNEVEFDIEMVEEDVREGCQGSIFDCPVARAAKRAIQAVKPEWVDKFYVQRHCLVVDAGGKHYIGMFPPEVRSWIKDFDHSQLIAGMPSGSGGPHQDMQPLAKFHLRLVES